MGFYKARLHATTHGKIKGKLKEILNYIALHVLGHENLICHHQACHLLNSTGFLRTEGGLGLVSKSKINKGTGYNVQHTSHDIHLGNCPVRLPTMDR